MNLKTFSSLTVAVAVLTLGATGANAATGCAASKAFSGLSTLTSPTEGNPAGLGQTPDAQALAKALGGFGMAAGLVAGGTMLYRKRQSEADPAGANLEFEIQPESVLVADTMAESVAVEESEVDREAALSLPR